MNAWPDLSITDKTALLVPLCETGKTAAQIATEVGASRSAVIAFCYRNGIQLLAPKNGRPVGSPNKPKFNRFVVGKTREERLQEAAAARQLTETVSRQEKWKPLPGSDPRPLHAVNTPFECSWPLWATDAEPKLFCGERCADRDYPYCKSHIRMALHTMPTLRKPYGQPDNVAATAAVARA